MEIKTLLLLLLASTLLLGSGCSSEGSRSSSVEDAPQAGVPLPRLYAGAGSRWDVALNPDGNFLIERRATATTPVVLSVAGSYEVLPNGFTQFSITEASGEDAPSPGDTAWAIEVPGYALFLKPNDSPFAGFITMVDAGSCPEDNFTSHWIVTDPAAGKAANDPQAAYLGRFDYDVSNRSASLSQRFSLDGFNQLPSVDIGFDECSDGVMMTGNAVVYVTANGGALVHTIAAQDEDREIVFAMREEALAAVSDLDGAFIGLRYDIEGTNAVDPLDAVCNAGLCTIDIRTGVQGEGTVETLTLDLFGTLNNPLSGVVSGELRNDEHSGAIACLVNQNLGDDQHVLLSCTGQSPGNPAQSINLILRG